MKIIKQEKVWTEPPPGFGDDEISRQMIRNAETFEEWYRRNRRKMNLANLERIKDALKAAFYRLDLP